MVTLVKAVDTAPRPKLAGHATAAHRRSRAGGSLLRMGGLGRLSLALVGIGSVWVAIAIGLA